MHESMPTLCLIGHTEYSLKMRSQTLHLPFGEVNHAKKLHSVLKSANLPVTEILDFYELFGVKEPDDPRDKLLREMQKINREMIESKIDFINDFKNDATKTLHHNLQAPLKGKNRVVLLFLTWVGKALLLLSSGIQKHYPIIAKEDSYIQARFQPDYFPMKNYAKEVQLITSESPLGGENLQSQGVYLDQFLYIPNLAPPEAETLFPGGEQEKNSFKKTYLQTLAKNNKKSLNLTEKTLVIGYPSRFVRRKNVDLLIYAFEKLHQKHPDTILVLKGDLDAEFDMLSLYSEKLHQLLRSAENKPWFFWDRDSTSYPEVLKIYASFDICPYLSGAELGCNTIVELCMLGVPLLLLEASVMPSLYHGMAEFVKAGELCESTWVYRQPDMEDLFQKLEWLITNPDQRERLKQNAKKLAKDRFGKEQLLKRLPLAAKAAWSFFHHDAEEAYYRKLLLKQWEIDLNQSKNLCKKQKLF